jgi:hypothetical protein
VNRWGACPNCHHIGDHAEDCYKHPKYMEADIEPATLEALAAENQMLVSLTRGSLLNERLERIEAKLDEIIANQIKETGTESR